MADDNKAKIVLSAEDKTKAAFDSAKKGLKELQERAERLPASFGTIGVAIAGAFEAATLKEIINIGDELSKLSQKTGFTVESLSALKYAGSLANVGIDDLATGVKKLGNLMADAGGGGKQAQAVFEALGVSFRTTTGTLRNTDQVLGDIADKFAGYEDGAGKAALATELFGKNGVALIPFLNQGREGLAASRKEAEQFGIVMGEDFAKASEQFNDNLTKINASLSATKIAIANEALPSLNKFLEALIGIRKAREQGGFFGSIAQEFNANILTDRLNTVTDDIAKFEEYIAQHPNSVGAKNRLAQLRDEYSDLQKRIGAATESLKAFANVAKPTDRGAFEEGFTGSAALSGKKKAPSVDKGGAQESLAAFDAIIKKIQERSAAEAQLLSGGRDLTEGEKFGLQVVTELGQAHSKLTNVQKAQAAAELEQVLQLAKGNDERKRQLEADKATSDAAQQHIADIFKQIDAQRDANKTLGDQIEEIGLTADGLDRLRIKRLESAKAQEEENLALARGKDASDAELTAMQQNIDLLDRQINLRRAEKASRDRESNDPTRGAQRALDDYVDTAKKAGDSAEALTKKTTQGLEDGLTAALTGGKFGIHQFVDEVLAEIVRLSVVKPFLASIFSTQGASLAGGIGGVISGIASIFGGTFADGGMLGAGKWGIAGEAGPEWVKGPAQMVPMTGGGGYVDNRTVNNYIDSNTNQAQIGSIVSGALQSYDRDLMNRLKAAGVGA